MGLGLTRTETELWRISYHIVWVTHPGTRLDDPGMATACGEIFEDLCVRKGWELQDVDINPTWLALQVSPFPSDVPRDVITYLKVESAKALNRRFEQIASRRAVWTRAFLIVSVGDSLSEDETAAFLRQQGALE